MSDIDTLVETTETITPYSDFADWLSNISIGSKDIFLYRWNTIHRLIITPIQEGEFDNTWFDYLLKLSLGNLKKDLSLAAQICEELKQEDVMFSNAGGKCDEELQVLAAYCLRLLTDEKLCEKNFISKNIVKIQSASLNQIKGFKGGVDLLSIITDKSFALSRSLREMSQVKKYDIKLNISSESEAIFEKFEEFAVSPDINQEAIQSLKEETLRLLEETKKYSHLTVNSMNNELNKVSEEQEVLWFITLGWSDNYNKAFSELTIEQRVSECALELAERTLLSAELPSVKGLAAKLGISDENIVFGHWIEVIAKEQLSELKDFSSQANETTPVLLALQYAFNGGWKSKWKADIGLDYNFEIDARELVLQLYRELLTINWS